MSRLPASFLRPAVSRLELGLPQRRRNLMNVMLITIVVGVLAIGAVIGYLLSAHREFVLVHGYPRADLLPGAFVSDRYSLSWFAIAFAAAHVVPHVMLLWSLKNIVAGWKRTVHMYMSGAFLLVDFVVLIILWIVSCLFCNNSLSAGSICNDPARYCLAFPDTSRCPPLAPNTTAIDVSELATNPAFSALAIWLLVFLALDVAGAALNSLIASAVRSFVARTQGQGFVRF